MKASALKNNGKPQQAITKNSQFTISEAAKYLEVSPASVRNFRNQNRFPGAHQVHTATGDAWVIPLKDLAKVKVERQARLAEAAPAAIVPPLQGGQPRPTHGKVPVVQAAPVVTQLPRTTPVLQQQGASTSLASGKVSEQETNVLLAFGIDAEKLVKLASAFGKISEQEANLLSTFGIDTEKLVNLANALQAVQALRSLNSALSRFTPAA